MNNLHSLAEIARALAAGKRVQHWSAYWQQTDEVLAVNPASRRVTVRGADGRVRHHSTDLFQRGDRNWF